MKYKKKIILLISLSIIMIGVGYFLSSPTKHGICDYQNINCGNIIGNWIGAPLFFLSVVLFFIFLIFLFFKEEVFDIWKKFAKIYIPIAILIMLVSPSRDGMFYSTQELAIWLLSLIFFIASVLIMIPRFCKWSFWIILPISFVVGLITLYFITVIL